MHSIVAVCTFFMLISSFLMCCVCVCVCVSVCVCVRMSVQAYLHANKIIHRDLTSNNCMIRTVSLSVCVCARLYGYVHACTCVCVLGVCVCVGRGVWFALCIHAFQRSSDSGISLAVCQVVEMRYH